MNRISWSAHSIRQNERHEAVLPLSLSAETRKLVLTHEDPSKPVRVQARFPLGIGDFIKFTKCLAERLTDAILIYEVPPASQLRRVGRERVPKPDLIENREVD